MMFKFVNPFMLIQGYKDTSLKIVFKTYNPLATRNSHKHDEHN